MSDQKPSKKSEKNQEEDLQLPSLDQIAEALKGADLETVDWTPEEIAKMEEYERNKAHPNNSQTPTQEKLEQTKQPKTTPKKES